MGPYDYEVADIRGEYVYLRRTDIVDDDLFMIAMALLPLAIDIGVKLHYENFEYSIK
ncbi:MAG: chorismate--pyruvate lyase [Clostridia bacterium]